MIGFHWPPKDPVLTFDPVICVWFVKLRSPGLKGRVGLLASVRFWPKIMLQEPMLQEQLLQVPALGAWIIWINIFKFSMLQEHVFNALCFRSIFTICSRSIVQSKTCSWNILLYMLLEHCVFDLEYNTRIFLLHLLLEQLVLEHNLESKSGRSGLLNECVDMYEWMFTFEWKCLFEWEANTLIVWLNVCGLKWDGLESKG